MASSRTAEKSAAAFRTISEVSEELDVPQHVLRFWETKFTQVRPLKRGGGRRYYRPEDVELLRRIRGLLYDDGYTIKGVQKLLRENSGRAPLPSDEAVVAGGNVQAPPLDRSGAQTAGGKDLKAVIRELESLRDLLQKHI